MADKPTVAEGQVIDFSLSNFQEGGFLDGATVTFGSVLYGKTNYKPTADNPNPDQKIAVIVSMNTSRGKTVTKEYSTGLRPGIDADITPDGKSLKARKGFKGLSKTSGAYYLLEKAVRAGFPEDRIKNDISVFNGSVFRMVSEKNPRASKSSEAPYPDQYFPDGDAAKIANPATATTITNTSSTSVDPEIVTSASEALMEILSKQASVTRADIPKALNKIAGDRGWDASRRQKTTMALWDVNQLKAVVNATPGLTLTGETVSLA